MGVMIFELVDSFQQFLKLKLIKLINESFCHAADLCLKTTLKKPILCSKISQPSRRLLSCGLFPQAFRGAVGGVRKQAAAVSEGLASKGRGIAYE